LKIFEFLRLVEKNLRVWARRPEGRDKNQKLKIKMQSYKSKFKSWRMKGRGQMTNEGGGTRDFRI